MKLILATKNSNGFWARQGGITRARQDGSVSFLPREHRGDVGGLLLKQAASRFAAEASCESIDHDVLGREYRVTRIA